MTSKDGITSNKRIERLSHGLYGLIIVTAALVAEQEHVDEAGDAIALLLGTALILFLAHTYSEIVALRVIEARPLGVTGLRTVVWDNVPLLFAIVVQTAFLLFAWLDVITLQTAYAVSIAYTLMALFGLGVYAGRAASFKWPHAILIGIEAGVIGIIIVAIEALFD